MRKCPSTHVGELGSARPSETSHSPARLVPRGGPVFGSATENARYHSLPVHDEQKDKWDILYRSRSTQFIGGNIPRAINSILACLDTRIRSWNRGIEKRTVNPADMLLPLSRASSTVTVSTWCRLDWGLRATPCPLQGAARIPHSAVQGKQTVRYPTQ
jgi:hypothetical protein